MDEAARRLALALATAIWEGDALHVVLSDAEKREIDRQAHALLIALGATGGDRTDDGELDVAELA